MKNGVINMEESGRFSELGSIPMIMGWENGRFEGGINSEDVSFSRLMS